MIIDLLLPVQTEPLCPVCPKTQDYIRHANGATWKSSPWILKVQWLIFNSLHKKNYFKPWARAMNHNAVEWSVAHAPVVGKHDWSHSTNNGEAFSIRKFGPAKTTRNTERFELCLHHSWSIRDYHQFHFRLRTEPAFFSVMQSRQTRAAAPPGR